MKPQVGWWVVPCCIMDLQHISTEEELADFVDQDDEMPCQFFPTIEAALEYLADDSVTKHVKETGEYDAYVTKARATAT